MNTNFPPAQLMHFGEQGILAKAEMAELLRSEARGTFLDACGEVERGFTRACAAHGDFCLASGCALEGESCLNAILNAGPEYNKACGREWVALFSNPANRGKA
jgi:hypothetical protein